MIGRSRWVVIGLMLAAASPVSLSGQARVVDGDTFTLGSERVRMLGIDAPEGRQTCKDAGGGDYRCGEVARDRLVGLIARRNVTCEVRDRDQYGRAVARCRVGDLDLGLEMVRGGWALEYRQFSGGAYTAAEAEARKARRGVWAGAFERPSEWRAAERSATAPISASAAPAASGGCVIKGNINAAGRRIFHVPGQEDYAATRIDLSRGERWFCTAAEARGAGWTAARR